MISNFQSLKLLSCFPLAIHEVGSLKCRLYKLLLEISFTCVVLSVQCWIIKLFVWTENSKVKTYVPWIWLYAANWVKKVFPIIRFCWRVIIKTLIHTRSFFFFNHFSPFLWVTEFLHWIVMPNSLLHNQTHLSYIISNLISISEHLPDIYVTSIIRLKLYY